MIGSFVIGKSWSLGRTMSPIASAIIVPSTTGLPVALFQYIPFLSLEVNSKISSSTYL